MKKIAIFLLMFALFSAPVCAQTANDNSSVYVGVRAGGLFSAGSDKDRFSIGIKLGGYLGDKGWEKNISAIFLLDYMSVHKIEGYFYGFHAGLRKHKLMLGPGMGFDLVRNSRTSVTLSGGLTFMVDMQTFSYIDDRNYGTWVNICKYYDLGEYCSSDWTFLQNGGISLRYLPLKKMPVYLGADYNRYSNGRNHFLLTFGAIF